MTNNNEKFITISAREVLYVTADGNYGSDAIVLIDPKALTDEQYEVLSELSDNDRLPYVTAILNGGDLSYYEE
jgi:hypothetical protein